MKVLQIKSSITGDSSVSSEYSNLIIEKIKQNQANVQIVERDLTAEAVIPLTKETLALRANPESDVAKQHDKLIDELKDSQVIILSAPVYNFQVPVSVLNYFDAVAQVGKTFNYTQDGPVGYIKAKAIVLVTSGGTYKDVQFFREDYLKTIFGFLGITDVQFIYVEGLAIGNTKEQISQAFYTQLNKIGV